MDFSCFLSPLSLLWRGGRGNLSLFENWIPGQARDDKKGSQSFVSLLPALPLISPIYKWTDNDVAYGELGDYITKEKGKRQTEKENEFAYPFRSLFTKRSTDEREFEVEENEDTITVRSLLFNRSRLVIPKEKVREKQNGDEKNRVDDAGSQIKINEIDFGQIYHSLPPRNVFISKNNDHQYDNNSQQTVNNDDLHEIRRVYHMRLSNQIAANNDAIPNTVLTVNTIDQSPRPEKTVGNMTNDPTQPAAKLVNNPDNTRATDRDFSTDITTTVAGDPFRVNIAIPKFNSVAHDSTKSGDLAADKVQQCGVLRDGSATAQSIDNYLRFTSRNQRGCLSFSVSDLPHRDGYLVAVENRHIAGRPMLFSLINQTAKHVELETYLQASGVRRQASRNNWQTDYFVLPPLAPDGLGYTVYLSNDAIGPASAKASAGKRHETVNDIASIKFYRIPYQELVTMHSANTQPQDTFDGLSVNPAPPSSRSAGLRRASLNVDVNTVSHTYPAYYKIVMSQKSGVQSEHSTLPTSDSTLILSQSFDPGWTAWEKIPTFPYLRQLKDHVLVSNWANGWRLQSDQFTNPTNEIVIFFWPQLLQWLGFALLPIPFLYALRKKAKE